MNKEQTALDVSRDIELKKVMPQQAAQTLTDSDISELIATAQYLQTVQHWEAQARCRIVAEIAKRLLSQASQPAVPAMPVAMPDDPDDDAEFCKWREDHNIDLGDKWVAWAGWCAGRASIQKEQCK